MVWLIEAMIENVVSGVAGYDNKTEDKVEKLDSTNSHYEGKIVTTHCLCADSSFSSYRHCMKTTDSTQKHYVETIFPTLCFCVETIVSTPYLLGCC